MGLRSARVVVSGRTLRRTDRPRRLPPPLHPAAELQAGKLKRGKLEQAIGKR